MSPLHPLVLVGNQLNPKSDGQIPYLLDMDSLGAETKFFGVFSNNSEEQRESDIKVTPVPPEGELAGLVAMGSTCPDPDYSANSDCMQVVQSSLGNCEHAQSTSSPLPNDLIESTEMENVSSAITIGHRKHFSDTIFMPPSSFLDSSCRHLLRRNTSGSLRKHQSDSELFWELESVASPELKQLPDKLFSSAVTMKTRKASTARDITSTSVYKEIYADNLRLYSFLVAKELGSRDYSPEHAGKSHLRHKFRVGERKNGSSTDSPLLNLRKNSAPVEAKKDGAEGCPSRKFSSTLSLLASRWKDEERAAAKQGNSSSAVRRKNAVPKAVTRRSSAPLTSTPRSDKPNDEDTNCHRAAADCTSCQLPTDAYSAPACSTVPKSRSMSSPCDVVAAAATSAAGHRSFSSSSLKRLAEARRRQSFRQEQLKSFDDILFQANTYIWDRKHSKNSSPTYSQVSSGGAMSNESPGATNVVWNFDNF